MAAFIAKQMVGNQLKSVKGKNCINESEIYMLTNLQSIDTSTMRCPQKYECLKDIAIQSSFLYLNDVIFMTP